MEWGAAALARGNTSIGEGRWIMAMGGGEWMDGRKSTPRLREASHSALRCVAAQRTAVLGRGVECSARPFSAPQGRAMQGGAVRCGAVQLQSPAAAAQSAMIGGL
jgi:hypothetical protein